MVSRQVGRWVSGRLFRGEGKGGGGGRGGTGQKGVAAVDLDGQNKEREGNYFDHRDDTVAPLSPFGHTTVSGFSVMPPPHAKPTQPRLAGAMIWSSVSNCVLVDALSGMAMRKTGIEEARLYSR